MFRFSIHGRRLSDDWDPFTFSHEDFKTRFRNRSKLFDDDDWFKEMPISRIMDERFSRFDKKRDKKDSLLEASKAEEDVTEPLLPGQTIELGRHRSRLFDDPWFKDFLDDDFFTNKSLTESKECAALAETKDVAEVENFKVTFEIGDFQPEEIEVTLDGDKLQVHGNRSKPGESREMFKSYKLPDGVNTDELSSSLSKDGLLQVTAPFKEIPKAGVKSDFEAEVPMVDFKPEDIQVTVDGCKVKVHAKKDEESADNAAHEEVTRWFTLPDTASAEGLTTSLDADGSIVIQIPMGFSGSLEISGGEAAGGEDASTSEEK